MAGSHKHLGIPPHEWRAEYLRKIELLSGGVAHACTPLPETASPTQPALNESHWRWCTNPIGPASLPPLTNSASVGHRAGPAQSEQLIQDLAADGDLCFLCS
jgi:hypothetical protein